MSATYKQTSRTVREESGELKQQTLRPADVHLEMAFGPNRPPFSVWLYFDREPEGTHLYGEERGHALRFTFESEETGEIQAELALTGNLIRVQIAAGRAEMAAAIEEQLETLEARLEAKGLKVGGLFVARSLPAHATRHASDHLDEEI